MPAASRSPRRSRAPFSSTRKECVNMWNEARSNAPGATPAVARRVAGQPWQESPVVGAGDLLKKHASLASKKFTLHEKPFCDLVIVRGEARDAAFVTAVQSVT